MEVTLQIPEDLRRRFEFIPGDVLPSVLVMMLRKSFKIIDGVVSEPVEVQAPVVQAPIEPIQQASQSSISLEQIFSAIQDLKSKVGEVPVVGCAPQVIQSLVEESVQEPEIIKPMIEDGDDDDLGDLLDMMK